MNYITFKIEEEQEGDFVLYLNNHSRELVSEIYRSQDLNEVVSMLKKEIERRKHFMNALGNFSPVLKILDELEEKYPDASTESFPEDWEDSLELYGCFIQEFERKDMDIHIERHVLIKLLEKESPQSVWKRRMELVVERIFESTF